MAKNRLKELHDAGQSIWLDSIDRRISFCGHVVVNGELLEVADTLLDERFRDNPFVTSGPRIRFAAPALLRPLIDARIGFETMDTAAACRTYNVLLAEGRSVVAALLFAGADRPSR